MLFHISLFGAVPHNELFAEGLSPLIKTPQGERPRNFTQHENDDFKLMTQGGPAIHHGTIPCPGPDFPKVISIERSIHFGIPAVIAHCNNLTCIQVFSLNLRFRSELDAQRFINACLVVGLRSNHVRSLLARRHNRASRRIRAHKIQMQEALIVHCNRRAQAGHGATCQAFRRRGLVCKIEF